MTFFGALALLALGQCLAEWKVAPTAGIVGWLTAAIGFLFIAVCARPAPEDETRARNALPVLMNFVVGMSAAAQVYSGPAGLRSSISIWILLIGLALLYLATRRRLSVRECRKLILPVIMLGFLLIGIKTIRGNPNPPIDLFVMQQSTAQGMTELRNPYTITIPDIYGPDSPYYIPLEKNGQSLYGFSYPPLVAFFNLPAYWLTGDVRYGCLFELLLSCALIALMQESWLALCGAALLLINPFSFMMVQYGWTEPPGILMFCLTVFAVGRYPGSVPWLFGLFLSAKQTNLAILPLGWLLLENPSRRVIAAFFGKALAVVAALYLPFYFWNPGAFVLSLITVQLRLHMRLDEISYAAFAAVKGWFILPVWLPFLYLPPGIWLGLRKAPRSPAGFAAASTLLLVPFFALSKQGAPNYYFFAISMLCCVLALASERESLSPR